MPDDNVTGSWNVKDTLKQMKDTPQPNVGAQAAAQAPSPVTGEETPKQETTKVNQEVASDAPTPEQPKVSEGDKVNVPEADVEKLEKERKTQARIARQLGEKAARQSEAADAAILAILESENAKDMLEVNPSLADEISKRFPDQYASLMKEDEVVPPKVLANEEAALSVADKATALMAERALAGERKSKADSFGAVHGLNEDEVGKMRRMAEGMVKAESTVSFEKALEAAYISVTGKQPTTSPILAGGGAPTTELPKKETVELDRVQSWMDQGKTREEAESIVERAATKAEGADILKGITFPTAEKMQPKKQQEGF